MMFVTFLYAYLAKDDEIVLYFLKILYFLNFESFEW